MVLVLSDDPVHGAQLRAHDPHQVVQVADDVHAQQRRADGEDVEVKLEREREREINEISSFYWARFEARRGVKEEGLRVKLHLTGWERTRVVMIPTLDLE